MDFGKATSTFAKVCSAALKEFHNNGNFGKPRRKGPSGNRLRAPVVRCPCARQRLMLFHYLCGCMDRDLCEIGGLWLHSYFSSGVMPAQVPATSSSAVRMVSSPAPANRVMFRAVRASISHLLHSHQLRRLHYPCFALRCSSRRSHARLRL